MKTKVIHSEEQKPEEPAYPCIFENISEHTKDKGEIVLAFGPNRGVVIHSTNPSYPIGYSYSIAGFDSKSIWRRITTPISIVFSP